jgi:hypothetical protein
VIRDASHQNIFATLNPQSMDAGLDGVTTLRCVVRRMTPLAGVFDEDIIISDTTSNDVFDTTTDRASIGPQPMNS